VVSHFEVDRTIGVPIDFAGMEGFMVRERFKVRSTGYPLTLILSLQGRGDSKGRGERPQKVKPAKGGQADSSIC
jgi:hypothetical protein